MVTKLLSYYFTRMQKAPPAHKMFIIPIFLEITKASSFLPGYKGATMECSCRNTDHSIEMYSLFQKHIQYTGCVNSAHCAAFQNKSCFHRSVSPLCCPIAPDLVICFVETDLVSLCQFCHAVVFRITSYLSVRQGTNLDRCTAK